MKAAAETRVRLRPVTRDDRPFLLEVYGSIRGPELVTLDWSEEQKAAFVEQQFTAQDAYYRQHYQGADWSVILVDEEPAGRLYVARWEAEMRIVDVALLPPFRGRGVGSTLLRGLLAEGVASGRPVTIHVERFNPALRLYERLGFRLVEDKGVYLFLRWEPPRAS